jgi:hypothetical protein
MTYFDGFLHSDYAILTDFMSVYDNDPYLSKFKVTNNNKELTYKTIFEGSLTNLEDPLKCTLTEFKSIYKDDLYLSNFKETIKDELDEFLV